MAVIHAIKGHSDYFRSDSLYGGNLLTQRLQFWSQKLQYFINFLSDSGTYVAKQIVISQKQEVYIGHNKRAGKMCFKTFNRILKWKESQKSQEMDTPFKIFMTYIHKYINWKLAFYSISALL